VFRTHAELDLTRQADVEKFFETEKPEYVVLSAARVGGIGANSTYPADFIYENLAIAQNVIHAAYQTKVRKLVNLGSSCIYPKMAPQPMKEDSFLTGPLEITNEAYAIAKIAAIRLCKHFNNQYGTNFISGMPTNMYGPGDNYDLNNSHVLPAMIRKFHEAKVNGGPVVLWGDGSACREFLYSDDLADAVVYLMENKDFQDIGEFVNIGSGSEVTIKELSQTIAAIVGYAGEVTWDTTKPNGTPRKLMDSTRLFALGWKPKVDLETGIRKAYADFLSRQA
jgi:GDP-L-fucose synthase